MCNKVLQRCSDGLRRKVSLSMNDMFNEGRGWYIVQTMTNREQTVKRALDARLDDTLHRVLIPTASNNTKLYPGYVLVDMSLEDNARIISMIWNIPGVVRHPFTIMSYADVMHLLELMVPSPKATSLVTNQSVKIVSGPFEGMLGIIQLVANERIKVLVSVLDKEIVMDLETKSVILV